MAERRMINRTIVDSDAFLDLPVSAQNLYFHLNLRADDEGFIDAPKKIMRTVNASVDDLKLLLSKRYLLGFESGVIVIKHWKLHNLIRGDRMKQTLYQEEKAQISEKDNGAYTTTCQPIDNQVSTNCQPSIVEVSIGKESIEHKAKKHKYGEYKNVLLTDEEVGKLRETLGTTYHADMIIELDEALEQYGYKYKSHYLTILKWHKKNSTQTTHSTGPTYAKLAVCRNKCTVCGKQADLRYGKCEECTG